MFIVAEISGSHAGSLLTALSLVEAAAEAGADAVKFQCYEPEQMAIPYTIKSGLWEGRDLVDLYQDAHTPKEWFPKLYAEAEKYSLVAFSSPFHADDVKFLESIGNPIYKISSFEITDLELIKCAASTGKPMFISTGSASDSEIARASIHCDNLTLLHCVSEYPTRLEDVNLATMLELYKYSDFGISDHSPGSIVPIAATILGAKVIEKHICFDGIGTDSGFALNPGAFKSMVNDVRAASKVLGKVKFGGDTALRRSGHIIDGRPQMKRPNISAL